LAVFYKGEYKLLNNLASKDIRLLRGDRIPICQYKIGLDLTPAEAHTWLYNLNKLTSIRHRNVILKVAHADIYCKERMFRFGLIDSPNCARCNNLETIQHKLLECDYASRIVKELIETTNQLRINQLNPNEINIRNILDIAEPNETTLTVHAEVISSILWLKDSQNFLLRPRNFIRTSIEHLLRCEANTERKQKLKTLLEHLE